jgi:hypothetical protein
MVLLILDWPAGNPRGDRTLGKDVPSLSILNT